MKRTLGPAIALVLLVSATSYADVALLLEDAYGQRGKFDPTGHAAVFLSRICAASPTVLRRCRTGETGVVISRYHRIAGLDWVAIPFLPYLYGVDRVEQVPTFATPEMVASLRDQYRHAHLRELIPDGPPGTTPPGDWVQLVGASYNRRIVVFNVDTTQAQDDELITQLNSRENEVRFQLLFRNCADFARDIINSYYPKALRSSFVADLGITTPKQIAKSLVGYGAKRPSIHLTTFVIVQVPGSRPPSKKAHGVLESLVTSKKYAVPLMVLQPWVITGLAAGYLTAGRFDVARYAMTIYDPAASGRQTVLTAER
jgi:hypothetical protein